VELLLSIWDTASGGSSDTVYDHVRHTTPPPLLMNYNKLIKILEGTVQYIH